MRLGKHISALLYEHERVIVPGFGTFTKHYVPAKFIPEKQIVEAPRKIADFHLEPSTGNTPLIAYMAEKEGVTQEEVTRFIEDVVREIHMTLDAGKTVELENLGRFRKDEDGALQFDANTDVNYMAETPGRDPVKTPPQQATEPTAGVIPGSPTDKKEPTDEKQRRS